MWPQLGGHLVVQSHLEPFGPFVKPIGDASDARIKPRGAADVVTRIGGAIALLVVSGLNHEDEVYGKYKSVTVV